MYGFPILAYVYRKWSGNLEVLEKGCLHSPYILESSYEVLAESTGRSILTSALYYPAWFVIWPSSRLWLQPYYQFIWGQWVHGSLGLFCEVPLGVLPCILSWLRGILLLLLLLHCYSPTGGNMSRAFKTLGFMATAF